MYMVGRAAAIAYMVTNSRTAFIYAIMYDVMERNIALFFKPNIYSTYN